MNGTIDAAKIVGLDKAREFLALPKTSLPGVMWADDYHAGDLGDPWEWLRDAVRAGMPEVGEYVHLRCRDHGWDHYVEV